MAMSSTNIISVAAVCMCACILSTAAPAEALQHGSRIGLVNVDNGNAVGRCRDCVNGAVYPDTVFIHVPPQQLENSLFAQWDVEELPNGKIALRSADLGLYLSRCYQCGPASMPNSATVHVRASDLAASPWAQFDLVKQEQGHVALRADNGDYLALCEDCWSNVARTGAFSDQHLFVSGTTIDGPSGSEVPGSSSEGSDSSTFSDLPESSSAHVDLPRSAKFDVVYIGSESSSSDY